MIAQHLEVAALFALIGLIVTWLAHRAHFFRLPKPSQTPIIRFPLIGFLLYLLLFLFAAPLTIALLSALYTPLATAFKSRPALMIGTAQVFSILIISILLILFSLMQRKGAVKQIWMENPSTLKAFKDFGIGILAWIISFPVVVFVDQIGDLLTLLFFGITRAEQLAVRYLRLSLESPYLFTIALIAVLIAAPIIEEWVFRGFIQTYLKNKLGIAKALILSSLIFAFFHLSLAQGIANISLLFSLFILALYLGFIYERQKSLLASIALHMTFNSVSVMRIILFSN